MISKEIEWEGLFDEEKHEATFYFHLTKDDIISMELGGNLTDVFRNLQKSGDAEEKYNYIRWLIRKSYGIRDGERFDKTDEKATEQFMHSPMFDSLIMELLSDETSAIKFIIGILPRDLSRQISQEEIDKAMAEARAIVNGGMQDVQLPADPEDKPDLGDLGELTEEERLEIIRRKIHEG